jgi:hypothetical protein
MRFLREKNSTAKKMAGNARSVRNSASHRLQSKGRMKAAGKGPQTHAALS